MVSGSLWSGAPRQVLDLARSGVITLFTGPELLAELADVLKREKFAQRLEQAGVTADELVYGYAAVARTPKKTPMQPEAFINCSRFSSFAISMLAWVSHHFLSGSMPPSSSRT